MALALREAGKGKGFVKTNPVVGAVIVKNNRVISKGYHKDFGGMHAEVDAISNSSENPGGAVLYVTLEPCSTYGKTPPCTEAIIKNKIRKVVIGTLDPNPKHNGKAVEILKKNNIEVVCGVLEQKCRKLIRPFAVGIKENRPYVILKLALTLDGKTAAGNGDSKWITNYASRKAVHKLRHETDAVMVGKRTALKDNPSLTVRHIPALRQPDRIVINNKLDISTEQKIFDTSKNERIYILTKSKDENRKKIFKEKKNLVLIDDYSTIKDALKQLYKNYNIGSVLLEGGSTLAASFFREKIIDKIYIFYAPKIIGREGVSAVGTLKIESMKEAVNFKNAEFRVLEGGDFLFEGETDYFYD